MKTYTIHRGTVRSSFALYHHTMAIYRRHTWANAALGKATANLIAADRDCSRMADLIPQGKAHSRELDMAKRNAALASQVVRAAQSELKNATARATEASKMHLMPFIAPYVPAKASRVYPAMKTCTSPRRAAIASQRALFAASIGTPEQARASGFKWYETDIKASQASFTDKALFGDRPRGF